MNKSKLLSRSAVLSLIIATGSHPVYAQVDEIIITATKRAENSQDVAVAVTALDRRRLRTR